jgi:hypothetical protein
LQNTHERCDFVAANFHVSKETFIVEHKEILILSLLVNEGELIKAKDKLFSINFKNTSNSDYIDVEFSVINFTDRKIAIAV